MQAFLCWSVVICGVAVIVSGVVFHSVSGIVGFSFGTLALIACAVVARMLDRH